MAHEQDVQGIKFYDVAKDTKARVMYWDITKGITIMLVILGHISIPASLRIIIFSFHMPLFFIANGYFVKTYDIKRTFMRSITSLLIPYLVICMTSAAVCALWALIRLNDVVAAGGYFLDKTKAMLFGMSKTSTIFLNVESVGVAWFVCCLFLARNLYVFLMKILENKKAGIRVVAVLILTVIGCLIGQRVAFLPWSLDVAFTSLIFIAFGDWMRRTKFLDSGSLKILILSAVIWIGILMRGIHLEFAYRSYPLGIVSFIEAFAGSLVIIILSKYLENVTVFAKGLAWVGRNSMIILGIHTIELMYFNWEKWVFRYLSFGMTWFRLFLVKSVVILMITAIIKYFQRFANIVWKKVTSRE